MNGPAYCTTYKTYTPVSQTTDQQFANKVLNEIRNYTKDLSCTSSDQCKWKMFGNNPCGGPSTGFRYSTKNVDGDLLNQKSDFYTTMQTLFNRQYSIL